MRAHANQVVYAISSIIDNLDDMECCAEIISKIAVRHAARDIKTEMFHNLGKSVIGFLTEYVGSSVMNDLATKAWQKVFNIIVSVFESVLQQDSCRRQAKN